MVSALLGMRRRPRELLQRQTAEDRRPTAVDDRLLTLADNTRDADPAAAMRLVVATQEIAPEDQGPTSAAQPIVDRSDHQGAKTASGRPHNGHIFDLGPAAPTMIAAETIGVQERYGPHP
jgi:hypothetical protein